jgi:hypothetical protein
MFKMAPTSTDALLTAVVSGIATHEILVSFIWPYIALDLLVQTLFFSVPYRKKPKALSQETGVATSHCLFVLSIF